MSREEALEILEEIEENVGVCCAITMDPDEVLVLIDKLKEFLEMRKSRNLSTADMKTFKAYIITAHQFMLYKVNKVLRVERQHTIDPFPSVDTYKATNDLCESYKTEMAL